MNILIIEDKACSEFGGAEKSMFDYILHLEKLGYEIILVYAREGNWTSPENLKIFTAAYKLDLRPLAMQRLAYLKTLFILYKICQKNKISKVLTHTVHCFPLLRLLKIFTKLELIVYFKWIVNHNNIGHFNNWGISTVDYAYANSKYVADFWKKQNLKCKIQVLPNGISIPENLKINTSFDNINQLLYVGRIYEGKGLLRLIWALSSFPNLTLTICGYFNNQEDHENLEYHKKIIQTIDQLDLGDRVVFKGFIKTPINLMTPNTLVVIPSIWPEAASRVLYEAMMIKASVIASEVGGMGEVIGDFKNKCLFGTTLEDLVKILGTYLTMTSDERSEIANYLNKRFRSNYCVGFTHTVLDKAIK